MTAFGIVISEMLRGSSVNLFHIDSIVSVSAFSVAIGVIFDMSRSINVVCLRERLIRRDIKSH